METDLFPECQGGPCLSAAPLESWMAEALKSYPADADALACIPNMARREECFYCLRDFRQRGTVILSAMAEEVKTAIGYGRRGIGGIRLAGAIWNRGVGYEIGNEVACFYVFILSLTHPALAEYLSSEGAAAEAMRKAGWKP